MASLMKRGKIYYEQYYVGKKKKLRSLNTSSLQIAKDKLRQHESARFRGEEVVIPTKTAIAQVVGAFVRNLLGRKRARNAAKDGYYLRDSRMATAILVLPCCERRRPLALTIRQACHVVRYSAHPALRDHLRRSKLFRGTV
ncbi:MAG TPA: hypothetical protein VLX12_03985 [Syntrophorhabdales bacterium]|nr:hypothetical protein [Syntrophorhabdales bacterium]